jgi:hypothetical protein
MWLYTCTLCGIECLTPRSHEDAVAEAECKYPDAGDDLVEVCEDCYRRIMGEHN